MVLNRARRWQHAFYIKWLVKTIGARAADTSGDLSQGPADPAEAFDVLMRAFRPALSHGHEVVALKRRLLEARQGGRFRPRLVRVGTHVSLCARGISLCLVSLQALLVFPAQRLPPSNGGS